MWADLARRMSRQGPHLHAPAPLHPPSIPMQHLQSSAFCANTHAAAIVLFLSCLLGCEAPPPVPNVLVASPLYDVLGRQFELTLERPSALTLTCQATNDSTEILRRHLETSAQHHFSLRGFKADTRYVCSAQLDDATLPTPVPVEVQTEPLPEWLSVPRLTIAAPLEQTGFTLYNYAHLGDRLTFYDPALVIVDARGNVRWYYAGVGAADIDAHFQPGPAILYGGATPPRQTAPTVMTLDGGGLFIGTSIPQTPYEDDGSYHHDVAPTVDGKHLLAMTHEEYVDADGIPWKGFTLRELNIEQNEVSWSWSSIDDGYLTGALPAGTLDQDDPYHANAVEDQAEADGTYVYVSLARLDRILKIRKSTREVVWQLGWGQDFRLLESNGTPAPTSRWFYGQHDIHLEGNRLTLYDNGIRRDDHGGTNYTRVLELELDETARTARIVFEFTEPDWLEPFWGGYDLLPDGGRLITMAHCWVCNTPPDHLSALVQLDTAGKVSWRLDFDDPAVALYRAERFDPCGQFHVEGYCP